MNRIAIALLIVAAAAFAFAALVRVTRLPQFDLKRIEVRGDLRHVTGASVRAALAGRLRGNYFTLPLDETRRLLETVPWVAHASIRRVWPNRVAVTLTEHRALGLWDDGRLLSDNGELFVANADEAEIDGALPEFSGPATAAKEAARRFYAISARLAEVSLQVDAIDISERRNWSLRVSPAGDEGSRRPASRIELGRDIATAPLTQRVDRLIAAYPLIIAQTGGVPRYIDARYSSSFAVAPSTRSPTSSEPTR